MGQELLKGDYIQVDETPVPVQMSKQVRPARKTSKNSNREQQTPY
jgi:hypothetical protein